MWMVVQVQTTMKLEVNTHDLLDRMQSLTKTKKDNNMTVGTGVIFVEYDIELLRLIEQCVICDKNETRQ